MSIELAIFIILGLLFLLLFAGVWIFLALTLTGAASLFFFSSYSVGSMLPQIAFSSNESFVLTCLPLFIWMGELLYRSGASKDLYSGLRPWMEFLPGKLLHTNILACTIFAAVSGSSAVTAATISSIAVPELKRLGYKSGPVVGTLAGAGTLGILIPPSIMMIVYGAITGESVARLFASGVFPGLMLTGLFMLYIVVLGLINPSIAPPSGQSWSLRSAITGTLKMVPTAGLIIIVLGLIYAGIATPTEAAAVGVTGALGIILFKKKLNWDNFIGSCYTTLKTTSMVMFIVMGASLLTSAMAYLRIPQIMMDFIIGLGFSRWIIFTIFCLIYIGLGCLFDGVSMMLLTLPVVFPVMTKLGFDPVWFCVVLVILIETAQITPPVGFNLFVLQNVSGEPVSLIVRHSMPFFILMLLGIIILSIFPGVALWLPNLVFN
jgi:tripartite ATP-independent transporter DctM subunit